VQEDDWLVRAYLSLLDQAQHAGEGFAGVDRVEQDPFQVEDG
jgi:hypothetical protein